MNFLKPQSFSCVPVNGGTESSQISSKISSCSEHELNSEGLERHKGN